MANDLLKRCLVKSVLTPGLSGDLSAGRSTWLASTRRRRATTPVAAAARMQPPPLSRPTAGATEGEARRNGVAAVIGQPPIHRMATGNKYVIGLLLEPHLL